MLRSRVSRRQLLGVLHGTRASADEATDICQTDTCQSTGAVTLILNPHAALASGVRRLLNMACSPACQADDEADQDTDAEVVVSRLDFWDALADLRPSLSAAELARYQQLREGYEGRDRRR